MTCSSSVQENILPPIRALEYRQNFVLYVSAGVEELGGISLIFSFIHSVFERVDIFMSGADEWYGDHVLDFKKQVDRVWSTSTERLQQSLLLAMCDQRRLCDGEASGKEKRACGCPAHSDRLTAVPSLPAADLTAAGECPRR